VDEHGEHGHLEVSVGALDDTGPIRQMYDYLCSRAGLGPAAT
jgi:hypothetical protein